MTIATKEAATTTPLKAAAPSILTTEIATRAASAEMPRMVLAPNPLPMAIALRVSFEMASVMVVEPCIGSIASNTLAIIWRTEKRAEEAILS
jgi:H+/gluconate symporter-like permease